MWLGAVLGGSLAARTGIDPAPVAAAGNTPETLTQETAGTLATAAGPTVQPALSAAPRDIPVRRYNVADYGARPDDGLDDTAAIQATLDAGAAQGGGHVVLPGGRYDLRVQPPGPGHPHPLRLSPRLCLVPSAPGQLPVLRLARRTGRLRERDGHGRNYDDLVVRQLRSGIDLANRSRSLSVTGNSVLVQAGSYSDLQFGVTAASACETRCLLQGNTMTAAGVAPSFADPSWTVK